MGVVEIANNPLKVKEAGIKAARELIENGAEVIILGCSSMAGYSEDLEKELKVPIIDPVATTVKMAEAFTALGLRHAKIGLYSKPKIQKMK
jgi:allantoin racemase